jgi:hypothetical protein
MVTFVQEPQALRRIPTLLIGPLVGEKKKKDAYQVPMGAVDENSVQSGLSDTGSSPTKGMNDLSDL